MPQRLPPASSAISSKSPAARRSGSSKNPTAAALNSIKPYAALYDLIHAVDRDALARAFNTECIAKIRSFPKTSDTDGKDQLGAMVTGCQHTTGAP